MKKKLLSKTKIILFIFFLASHLSGSAQNFIYKGNQKYQATKSWKFQLNGDYWKNDPEFTIAKNSTGAYLMATITVPFKTEYIGGTLTIFLKNGEIIRCIDRKIRDHYDGIARTLFQLTIHEVELLKNSQIKTIRFNMVSGNPMLNGAFTASNLVSYEENHSLYNQINKIEPKESYATDKEIKELFID